MSKSATTLSPILEDLQKYFAYFLLHEHMQWMREDGEIITICKECNKEWLKTNGYKVQ